MMKTNILCCIGLLVCMVACRRSVSDERPVIIVTIEPMRYFVEQIGKNRFQVVSLVPPGSSPETYDPTPHQIMDVERSSAYFLTGGLGFEPVLKEKLSANNPLLPVTDTSAGIAKIKNDPHIWNSPANARIIVRNICETLCRIDTAGASEYRKNFEHFSHLTLHLDSAVRVALSGKEGSAFLIYHPALSYFARDYGLTQLYMEEEGKEPSPLQMKAMVDSCRSRRIEVAFAQPPFDESNIKTVARELGLTVIHINPLSYDWDNEILRIARSLKKTVQP